jgi:hypothetical protein
MSEREILFAHDAWHFLYNHPAFCLPERILVADKDLITYKKRTSKYYILKEEKYIDKNNQECTVYYLEWPKLFKHALQENLWIFYAQTDITGQVNDDDTKNKYTECWIEFGNNQFIVDYKRECIAANPHNNWDYLIDEDFVKTISSHDTDLDCGGPTFDEALVKLANNVLKKYGDYKKKWIEDDE